MISPSSGTVLDADSRVQPGSRYRKAYELALPDIEAIPREQVLRVNFDAQYLATQVALLAADLSIHREQAATLPGFDVRCFDQLETHALALGHAQTRFLAASVVPDRAAALAQEARVLRATLRIDIEALVRHGLLPADAGTRLSRTRAHRRASSDLFVLVQTLRQHWAQVGTRVAVTEQELDHAEQLADQLGQALDARKLRREHVREALGMRAKAFTLLVRTYTQVRRAVMYLHWEEGAADKIAPPIRRLVPKPKARVGKGRGATPTPVDEPAPTSDH